MTTTQTELERVLAECTASENEMRRSAEQIQLKAEDSPWKAEVVKGNERIAKAHADAARLLREIASDIKKYSEHPLDCDASDYWAKEHRRACTCGLDSARAKWRLK